MLVLIILEVGQYTISLSLSCSDFYYKGISPKNWISQYPLTISFPSILSKGQTGEQLKEGNREELTTFLEWYIQLRLSPSWI